VGESKAEGQTLEAEFIAEFGRRSAEFLQERAERTEVFSLFPLFAPVESDDNAICGTDPFKSKTLQLLSELF
jgi:hypothetical protein